jgi:hypothetical protein
VLSTKIKNKQNVQKHCARTLRYRRRHSPRKLQGLFTTGFNLVCSISGTEKNLWINLVTFVKREKYFKQKKTLLKVFFQKPKKFS